MAAPTAPRFTVPASPSVDLLEWMYWLHEDRDFGADDLISVMEKPTKFADLYTEYREQA